MHERDNQVLGMLIQEHGNKHRTVAYYIIQLHLVANAHLSCFQAIAVAAR